MGLFDAYKKNISEMVNAANEKIQASMNASAAQNFSQTRTSEDDYQSTQLLKLINQLDSLQGEVKRLSGVVSNQQKQLDDATRQISELQQIRTANTNASSTDSNTQPAQEGNELKEELDRWVNYTTVQIGAILKQLGNVADLLVKHGERITLIEQHTFM